MRCFPHGDTFDVSCSEDDVYRAARRCRHGVKAFGCLDAVTFTFSVADGALVKASRDTSRQEPDAMHRLMAEAREYGLGRLSELADEAQQRGARQARGERATPAVRRVRSGKYG